MYRHTESYPLSSGPVCKQYIQDAAGIIWIGSVGGLYHYDPKSDNFINISEENAGINIVQISSMTGDKEDNLWISTLTGIYMLNKKRDQIIRFGKDNGLRDADNSFTRRASATLHDGQLIFGEATGYFAFYPEKLTSAAVKTHLYFTGFWLDNKSLCPGNRDIP
jgi:hypothetical protein